ATANRRIVALLIGRGRVQHHEQHLRARSPAAPQRVTICSAARKTGVRSHTRQGLSIVAHPPVIAELSPFTRLPKGSSFLLGFLRPHGPYRICAPVCVRFNAVQYRRGRLNSAMNAVLFRSSKRSPGGDATALGYSDLKMRLGRILLLLALVPAAHAQLRQERTFAADPDVLLVGLPFTMRVELGLTPLGGLMAGTPSSVFTADY